MSPKRLLLGAPHPHPPGRRRPGLIYLARQRARLGLASLHPPVCNLIEELIAVVGLFVYTAERLGRGRRRLQSQIGNFWAIVEM